MRIAIDYRSALSQRVGVGRYTHNLVRGLSRLDKENDYLLFSFLLKGYRKKTLLASPPGPNFTLKSAPIPTKMTRFWANRLSIPVEKLIGQCDVVHFPEPYPFKSRSGRVIVTVHDVSFALMPQFFTKETRDTFTKQMEIVVRRADEIIAVSEQTKIDLMNIYGLDGGKIHVILHGVEESFEPLDEGKKLEEIRARFGLPDRFVLQVGTLEPRKNHRRLLEAYRLMCMRHGEEYGLVVCGKRGWLYDDLIQAAERPELRDRVVFTDYVEDKELPSIYNLSSAVVYPSLYEGFGLPILEAMACGKPLLTSNRGAMAEVAGDAALLVDPENVEEMAEGLHRLLCDEPLRERLARAGRERAQEFTWERAARATLDVYGQGREVAQDE